MILSETSDYIRRNSSANSANYYKIAYDEEKSGGNFEKEDFTRLMQRFKFVDGKLKSLTVMTCILIFLVCVHLICDFLSPSHTQIQSKRLKTRKMLNEDICEKGWYDGRFVQLGCLKFEVDMKSHEEAETFCKKENASLIEISRPAQLQVLVNMMVVLETSLGRGLWWAGGSDLSEDGEWTWSMSGRPIEDWVWGKERPEKAAGHNFLCFHYQVSYLGDDCYNNATWGRALCQRK